MASYFIGKKEVSKAEFEKYVSKITGNNKKQEKKNTEEKPAKHESKGE